MRNVVVIGGGAAGMMAAYSASQKLNNRVLLIEKNEKLGKKLYITGKGRCNLTNAVLPNEFLENVINNPKFLYGSLSALSSFDTIKLFEENGLKLKVERGKRVFPESDKASDVTKTLEKMLAINNVKISLNTTVKQIIVKDGFVSGVVTDKGVFDADAVVICTGGVSYPLTGSTGDGYIFAKSVGHSVIPTKSALVGIEIAGDWYKSLQGLSLKNVNLTAKVGEKVVFSQFGEMLFTHFGISGPIVLSCSSIINKYHPNEVKLYIDFKPALDNLTLDNRLIREFQCENRKNLASVVRSMLPKNLVDVFMKIAGISGNRTCSETTAEMRKKLIDTLKNFPLKQKALRPVDEAIVTAGGVNVKEVNPKTMESKLIKGLFFAGEVLDIDAFTGGFNIQIAFSTGYLAGANI